MEFQFRIGFSISRICFLDRALKDFITLTLAVKGPRDPENRVRGPKVAQPGLAGSGQKLKSRSWGLRWSIEASEPLGIALNHSATGTPRRIQGMFRRPQPTFLLKVDFFTATAHLTATKIFRRNFSSDFPFKPSPIDSPGSNYPLVTFAGSIFAFPSPV